MDIELYNYVDTVIRKLKMGILANEIKGGNSKNNDQNAQSSEDKAHENAGDDDDDETKKVVGIQPIEIGPDGVPMKRNNSDVMNNFFINDTARSFTSIEKILSSINQNDQRREKRF